MLEHFHTGTMTRKSEVLDALVPKCLVEMNPVDAAELDLQDGDRVKIVSRRGEITAHLRITEKSRPGSVFVPFHFAESAANTLTNPALDPLSKIPELKVCAVNITKYKE